jgi:hypothetical protein
LLQIKILQTIALEGKLSVRRAQKKFRLKYSTVWEPFKVLKNRKLINRVPDIRSLGRAEIFYKLSSLGLKAFISQKPSPKEFWTAMIRFFNLNPRLIGKAYLDECYNLFMQNYIGNFFLRSSFFQINIFDEFLKDWRKENVPKRYGAISPTRAQKVLECLALNRSITSEEIIEKIQIREKDEEDDLLPSERMVQEDNGQEKVEDEVRKILTDYTITSEEYYYYADEYGSVPWSSEIINVTMKFLNHFIIVRKNENGIIRYELSLLGILIELAAISLFRQGSGYGAYIDYYVKIASIYSEKLPLIFGKWELLKKYLDFSSFPSILDYLFLDRSQILSLSVLIGGNKEIFDNNKSLILNITNKIFEVYDQGTSVLWSFINEEYYQLIEERLKELKLLLKYADLNSFRDYMNDRRPQRNEIKIPLKPAAHLKSSARDMPPIVHQTKSSTNNYQDELNFIENALAEEFTFLFYIGLLRDNNHIASDYPLTTGFMKSSPNLAYPKWFLEKIIYNDNEIRNKVTGWIKESSEYQKLALEKMNEISAELQKG